MNALVLTSLADAMETVADGNGRIEHSDLNRLGFDDATIRRNGADAIRLSMTRTTTTVSLELVKRRG